MVGAIPQEVWAVIFKRIKMTCVHLWHSRSNRLLIFELSKLRFIEHIFDELFKRG